jgi:hypothetical protein
MSNQQTEDLKVRIFNFDVESSLCAICRELGQTTKNIVQYKKCEQHKHTHFCNFCRNLVTYSHICISCISGDLI